MCPDKDWLEWAILGLGLFTAVAAVVAAIIISRWGW